MKKFIHYFFILLIVLSGCTEYKINHKKHYNFHFFSSLILSDPWYEIFKKKYHRNPTLEIIQVAPESFYSVDLNHFANNQKSIINWFPQDLREGIIQSHKANLVSFSTRKFDSMERYFQMRHSSSDSIAEPGHVKGADFVLFIRPAGTYPDRYSYREYSMSVTFYLQLVNLRKDETVWTGEWNIFIDSIQGITDTINVSNPGFTQMKRKYENERWITIEGGPKGSKSSQ